MAILTSDTSDFRARTVIRHREAHYTMIKGPTLQEHRTLLTRKHGITGRKLIELQGETEEPTVMAGDSEVLCQTGQV